MRRTLLALAAAFCFAAPLAAEQPARTHDITVDDYFTQADVFEIAISFDGRFVAYTEGRWQHSTDDRKADLWVVETANRKSRRLTFDRASDRSPKWSADGRSIYFLGNRKREGEKQPPYDGKAQVWRIDVDGGAPFAVTRVEGGVGMFDLTRDGQSLIYTTEKEETTGDWQALKQRFGTVEYSDGVTRFTHVWKLDLQTWRAEKLVDDKRVVHELAVSPDGKRIAMITSPDGKVVSFEGQSRVDVYDAATKKVTPVPNKPFRADAPSAYGWLEKLAWSEIDDKLAFSVIFDGYPAEMLVTTWDGEGMKTDKVSRPAGLSLRGYGGPLRWRGAALCYLGEEKARVRLCATAGGKDGVETLTPGDVVVDSFDLTPAGDEAALLMARPGHFPEIFHRNKSGNLRRLTNLNPQTSTWKLPKLSVFSWKGANGDPVEGILEMPPDAKPGQRVPLVVEIHGGPTTATHFGMQFWFYGRTLLPAKGYAVLSPNYRGSTGYGDKFLTDLIGRANEIEVEDILKGMDALVERGIADADKLGVMGWSNGGYLTNCIISKTTRFKAASSGAGIVDIVMEWGGNDEPAYQMAFQRGLPWARAALYHKSSPTYQLDKIRTPTLIHVGGSDERCPPAHSRMLHRALREYVKVPTELLVYPGEPHGLTKYKNRKAKMEWDLAWFDRYILGKSEK